MKITAKDDFFMGLARLASTRSKDQSTKVGCVIVSQDGGRQVMGWNGFPRGVNDTDPGKHQRPAKYQWTEHAERNAIYNAARHGISTDGCTIYLMWFPCVDCVRGIVQAGISRMVCTAPDFNDERWGESFKATQLILQETPVEVTYWVPPEQRITQ